ncbi:hypothetical protein ABC304_09955 [Microbacterium sp. 1P10UB]|uniref:hypothetical protein n=1 Tax=unclassified Microbacterium TaxID=2609290 RepID=UPI0039A12131
MSTSSASLALTMKDAAELVGVDYRTIKLGIENGTIPTVQLGPAPDDPPRPAIACIRRRRLTSLRRARRGRDRRAFT